MKKFNILLAGILLALGTGVASANEAYTSSNGLYFDLGFTKASNPKDKVLDSFKIADVTGGGGEYVDLRVGWYSSPFTNSVGGRVYGQIWNNSKKNEVGLGIGGVAETQLGNSDFTAFFGGSFGIGRQKVKGKERDVTNLTTGMSHIVGVPNWNGKMVHDENTVVYDFSLELGTAYYITKNMSIDLAYESKFRYYNLKYHPAGANWNYTNINTSAWEHAVRLGLTYRF